MTNYYQHDMPKFGEIFYSPEQFKAEFLDCGLESPFQSENTFTTLYILLYSRYANSTIATSDVNRFKYQVYSIVWQYGGTWEKRVEIQKAFRALSLDENSAIYKGSEAIYNTALNPSQELSNDEVGAEKGKLKFINSQNTTEYRRNKLDGLANLNEMLKTDVTGEFLDKFRGLFVKVWGGDPVIYVTDLGEEENDT